MHAIPGDPDVEGGSLGAIHRGLGADALPLAGMIGGVLISTRRGGSLAPSPPHAPNGPA